MQLENEPANTPRAMVSDPGIGVMVKFWAGAGCVTVNVCEVEAGAYMALPACEAVMVQLPAPAILAVVLETVQMPVSEAVAAKVTVPPGAVALSASCAPTNCWPMDVQVIVWVCRFTVKVCEVDTGE